MMLQIQHHILLYIVVEEEEHIPHHSPAVVEEEHIPNHNPAVAVEETHRSQKQQLKVWDRLPGGSPLAQPTERQTIQ